jgi:hypothetical protein
MYSTYRWSSQLAGRLASVVYFITLSFFLLTLKVNPGHIQQSLATTTTTTTTSCTLLGKAHFVRKDFADNKNLSVLKHWHIYILTGGVSQLADRHSVVYFIALSFFHLSLKVSTKAFSQPHSGTITCYYYYYYYFLHFACESTSCKRDFAETQE